MRTTAVVYFRKIVSEGRAEEEERGARDRNRRGPADEGAREQHGPLSGSRYDRIFWRIASRDVGRTTRVTTSERAGERIVITAPRDLLSLSLSPHATPVANAPRLSHAVLCVLGSHSLLTDLPAGLSVSRGTPERSFCSIRIALVLDDARRDNSLNGDTRFTARIGDNPREGVSIVRSENVGNQ